MNESLRGVQADQRVVAIVPALNEARAIGLVIARLHAVDSVSLQGVIVVDNGSEDATARVAEAAGANVVLEPRRGYGYACHAGVRAAMDADILVFLDGDAADDPGDLTTLLAPLLSRRADLVVGSRVLGQREPGALAPHQLLGNRLASWLISRLYGVHVTDLGPFRAIRREALLVLNMQEMTYGWPVEMMVKAIRAGYRYEETPVSYHRRIGVSKVSGTIKGSFLAGYYILTRLVRYSRWSPRAGSGSVVGESTR